MHRNLRLLPWWWVLRWVWLGEGIWVIYLTDERGLTLGEALLFEAVYSAVVIATELPTGMVADRFGRRISLLIGTAAIIVAFLAFGTGTSLAILVIAYALFGVGETSHSGADTAMLYDSLKVVGREEDFTAWHGKLNALVAGGIGLFTIAGSLMVRWWPLWTPIILSALLTLPALFLAWRFTEPPRSEEDERHSYLETGRQALRLVWRTRALLWAMVLMASTSVAIAAMAVLQQHLLREAGVPIWGIGLFVAGQLGVAAIGSWMAAPIGRWLGLRRIFWLMPLGSALGLAAGAPGLVVLYPLFIFAAFGWNVMYPHFTEYLARRTTTGVRATVISLANVMSGLASIVIVPLTGFGLDRIGVASALLLLAGGLTAATILAALAWSRPDARAAGGISGAPDVDASPDAALP